MISCPIPGWYPAPSSPVRHGSAISPRAKRLSLLGHLIAQSLPMVGPSYQTHLGVDPTRTLCLFVVALCNMTTSPSAVQLHMDFHPVRIHQIVWSSMRHSTPKFGGDRYPPGRQVVIPLERLDRLTAPCGRSPLLAENVSTRPRACLQSSLIMVPLRAC